MDLHWFRGGRVSCVLKGGGVPWGRDWHNTHNESYGFKRENCYYPYPGFALSFFASLRTDGPTDRPTDRPTDPLIEMRGRI